MAEKPDFNFATMVRLWPNVFRIEVHRTTPKNRSPGFLRSDLFDISPAHLTEKPQFLQFWINQNIPINSLILIELKFYGSILLVG